MNPPYPRRQRVWQLACVALFATASTPVLAAENTQDGEIITIEGDQLPDCEAEYGIGYTEHFDLDGSFAGCVCADTFYCGDGPGYPGGDPGNPGGGGGGGGGGSEPEDPDEPDDECADGGCICEEEEAEPQWCELPSCQECAQAANECLAEANEEVEDCVEDNHQRATDACKMDLEGAPDLATCVENKLYGTPGNTDIKGHTGTIEGAGNLGIEFDLKIVKFGGGGEGGGSSSDTNGNESTRPFIPPDRDIYPDCGRLADIQVAFCRGTEDACMTNAEYAGETCDEE